MSAKEGGLIMPKIGNSKFLPQLVPVTISRERSKENRTESGLQSLREVILMLAKNPGGRHPISTERFDNNPLCVFCRHNLCCRLWRDGRKNCRSFQLSIF